MIKEFETVKQRIKDYPVKKVAVASGTDLATLESVCRARDENIAVSVIFGDEKTIRDTAAEAHLDLKEIQIVDVSDPVPAARRAVEEVSSGRADVFMKGYIHSDDFLRTVLDKEIGLRSGKVLNHVFILQADQLGRLIFITDGAMNVKPDLEAKALIISNTVALARLFDVEQPRVAVLSAVEVVTPNIESSVEAAILAKMSERRQFKYGIVDGPFAFDNAINPEAARVKKLSGEVAGKADVIVVPDVVTGNALAKSFAHLTGGLSAGIVFGAKAPVVLPSRSDPMECKLMGIACAVYVAGASAEKRVKIGKVHF